METLAFLPSLGLIFLLGLVLGAVAERVSLPPLVGYLVGGILLGESGFAFLSPDLLAISGELREIALVMILIKAGLTLQWDRLKTVGKPAIFLAFLPATLEILSCMVIAPLFFPLSTLEAALVGAVLAAVSPAVVVPRMVGFLERGMGGKGKAPEIVLAGASLDDVFVIVLFTSLLSLVEGATFSLATLLELPLSIGFAVVIGVLLGKFLSKWRFFQDSGQEAKILLLLGISFGLLGLEQVVPLSALLTIMIFAMCLEQDSKLSGDFTSLWKGAELLLFSLVGAEVAVGHALSAGGMTLVVLVIGLFFRGIGVYCATAVGGLSPKEKLFVTISYLPKATVQAGIGGIPLAMGLACGELVLTFAVVAIFATAPLGAWLIDRYGAALLTEDDK